MKITKQVTTVEIVDVDLSLPAYFKKDERHFKVYGEDRVVMVYCNLNNDYPSASIADYSVCSHIQEALAAEPSTEQEFNAAFEMALDHLKKNVDLWISISPMPQPEDFGLDPNGNEQQRDVSLITC